MNFNIYVNKRTGSRITKMAKTMNRSRNSIVNEALDEWLEHHTTSHWPKGFFNFTPIKDVPDFKAMRKGLKDNISEDPLA